MLKNADALVFVEEAIDAISIEMAIGTSDGEDIPISGPQCSIALELDAIRRQLDDPEAESALYALAERIRQGAIALYAAKAALTQTEKA